MWEKSCLCYVVCLQNCHTSSLLFVLWIFKISLSNKFHLKNVLGFLRKRFIIWIKTENGNDKFLSMCLLIWSSSPLSFCFSCNLCIKTTTTTKQANMFCELLSFSQNTDCRFPIAFSRHPSTCFSGPGVACKLLVRARWSMSFRFDFLFFSVAWLHQRHDYKLESRNRMCYLSRDMVSALVIVV